MTILHDYIALATETAMALGVTDQMIRKGHRIYDALQMLRTGRKPDALPPGRVEHRKRRADGPSQDRSARSLRSRDRTPPMR